MNDQEFVPISKAAQQVGISRITLAKAVNSGQIPEFQAPLDRRARLVRLTDVERLRDTRVIVRTVEARQPALAS